MQVQKSFQNNKSTLYIIPTPIGNLEDITIRALNILKQLNVLFCEDTRVTQKLLNYYDINLKLSPYHEFNQERSGANIISYLERGEDVGLVSDAGMPGISDPGFHIISQCIELDYNVVVLPGASALNVSIVRSNLATKQFTYFGFLNKQQSKRISELKYLTTLEHPSIIYESPHKLLKTLELIGTINPLAKIVIARELTKKFEEYVSGTISEVLDYYQNNGVKGECVIIYCPIFEQIELTDPLTTYYNLINLENYTKKDAIKDVAKKMGVNKNQIYQMVIESETESE